MEFPPLISDAFTRSLPRVFFFSFYFLPLSLQQAVLRVAFLTEDEGSQSRGERHNKSQSAEMKINDCLTQQSLKSGLNRTQKCLSNEKELQKHFVHINSSAPLQISGIKLRDNVSRAHLWEINFAT